MEKWFESFQYIIVEFGNTGIGEYWTKSVNSFSDSALMDWLLVGLLEFVSHAISSRVALLEMS